METSKEMIDELLSHVDEGSFVLEPSAGIGKLAFRLVVDKRCKVDVVELNEAFVNILENEGIYNFVLHGDFPAWATLNKNRYDCVTGVPPYKDNIDCYHIMKMYECTKQGGKVISFTLPTWVTGMYSNQVEFRKWLSDKNYSIKLFEDKSYVSCPKMLLIIQK